MPPSVPFLCILSLLVVFAKSQEYDQTFDTNQANIIGDWTVASASTDPFVGPDFLLDDEIDQVPRPLKSVQWTVNLPYSGFYELRYSYPSQDVLPRSSEVPFTFSNEGAEEVFVVDQTQPAALTHLATFHNDAGSISLTISNDVSDNGTVVADAIQVTFFPASCGPEVGCCVAGYQLVEGVCSMCSFGSFKAENSTDGCTPCAAGSAQDQLGQLSCDECAAGAVQPTPGSTSCFNCTLGSYSVDGLTCVQCHAGTFLDFLAEGAQSCQPCNAGSVQSEPGQTMCDQCPPNTYSVGGLTCENCTEGSFSLVPGEGPGSCTTCIPGSFLDTANSVCVECYPGTVQPLGGQTLCNQCPPNTYSVDGLTCENCPEGSFSLVAGEGPDSCSTCNPGSFLDVGSSVCLECPPGTTQALGGQTSCTNCTLGSYSVDGLACVQCGAGTFLNSLAEGAQSCLPCDDGSISAEGQTECTECDPASYANAEHTECVLCGDGTVQPDPGQTSCIECLPGQASVNGLICQNCPEGTYLPTAAAELSECIPCPPGSVSQAGADSCDSCSPGTIPNVEQTECLACEAGYIQPLPAQTVCDPCDLGSYSFNGTTCEPCAGGTFADTPTDQCTDCGLGFYSTPESSFCAECAPGSYGPLEANPSCLLCDPGSFSLMEASLCSLCEDGFIQPFSNQSSCYQCDLGFYSVDRTECTLCPGGTFLDEAGAGINACKQCPTGTFSAPGDVNCTMCPAGTFADEPQSTGCEECQNGYFSLSGQEECSQCPNGTYTNAFTGKADSCEVCPANFRPNTAQDNCVPCGPGLFAPIGSPACIPCDVGTFSLEGFSCTDCLPGTYTNQTQTAECEPASLGYFVPDPGSTFQLPCPSGTYANEERRRSCLPCNPGSFANETTTIECEPAPAGYYVDNARATFPIPCDPGSFSNNEGQKSCTLCPTGTYASEYASTECSPTPPGYYADDAGQSEPKPCIPGTYAETNETKQCLPCNPGSYNTDYAQTECIPAPLGHFIELQGQTTFAACPEGYFSDEEGRRSCRICQQGFYSDVEGSELCTPAPLGYITPLAGSNTTQPCPPGSASGQLPGSYQCQPCDDDSFAQFEASQICEKCPDDSDSVFYNNILCLCSPEFYSLSEGGQCYPCPAQAICNGSTTIRAKPGFWRADDQSLDFFECINIVACEDNFCQVGYYGPACGICAEDFGRVGDSCYECVSPGLSWLIFMLTFITVIVGLTTLVYFKRKRTVKSERASAAILMKTLITHLQIMSFVGEFRLQWTQSLKQLFGISNVASPETNTFIVNCVVKLDFYDSFIITMMIPFATVVISGIVNSIIWGVKRLMHRKASHLLTNFIVTIMVMIFFSYPTITSKVLSTFVCKDIGGVRYQATDFQVSCEDDSYQVLRVFASILLVFYCIGIPALGLGLLIYYRKRLEEKEIRARYSFLYDGFKTSWFFWEIVILARKFLIVVIIAFIEDVKIQTYAAVWVVLISSLAHIWAKPFRSMTAQRLELLSLLVILFTLLIGLLFYEETMSQGVTTFMSFVLFVLNFVVLISLIFVILVDIFRGQLRKFARSKLRQRSGTVDLGELDLGEEELKELAKRESDIDEDSDGGDEEKPEPRKKMVKFNSQPSIFAHTEKSSSSSSSSSSEDEDHVIELKNSGDGSTKDDEKDNKEDGETASPSDEGLSEREKKKLALEARLKAIDAKLDKKAQTSTPVAPPALPASGPRRVLERATTLANTRIVDYMLKQAEKL